MIPWDRKISLNRDSFVQAEDRRVSNTNKVKLEGSR